MLFSYLCNQTLHGIILQEDEQKIGWETCKLQPKLDKEINPNLTKKCSLRWHDHIIRAAHHLSSQSFLVLLVHVSFRFYCLRFSHEGYTRVFPDNEKQLPRIWLLWRSNTIARLEPPYFFCSCIFFVSPKFKRREEDRKMLGSCWYCWPKDRWLWRKDAQLLVEGNQFYKLS